MYDNRNLPICPKCNDTKNVKDEGNVKIPAFGPNKAYKCSKCNVTWEGYTHYYISWTDF